MSRCFTRAFILATAFVVPPVATASSAGATPAFDGAWHAVIVTRSGACNVSFAVGGKITNGVIHYGG